MAELECVKEDLWLLILPWRNTEPTSVISQGWERSKKDHRTLQMHFNVSQTQESPISTKGIQTNSFKNTANGVLCELDME